MADAIAIKGLCKSFGAKRAVQELDLAVPEGSLYGFIGPNGAGKTTTIRMVMSIIFPDSGELSVLGRDSAVESKDRIGYLPEERGVYRKMKVGAFLTYMAKLKGVDNAEAKRRTRMWLERVELADCFRKRCEELSKGMQQKIQFISAVIHKPDLIILDEPFSGLDPVNMRLLRDLFLEQHAEGRTIIFSTHVMHQAEQLCDHLVMINGGRKVLDASLDEIRRDFDPRSITFQPLFADADVGPVMALDGVERLERVDRNSGGYEASLADGVDPMGVIRAVVDAIPVTRIEVRRPSLEDIFIDLVEASEGSAGARRVRAAVTDEQAAVEGVS